MSASSRYMPSTFFINSLKDSDFKERLVHFNGTVVFLLKFKAYTEYQQVTVLYAIIVPVIWH